MNRALLGVLTAPRGALTVSIGRVRFGLVASRIAECGTLNAAWVRAKRGAHAPYAKGNFQFERVIVGWRLQRVLDLRRK